MHSLFRIITIYFFIWRVVVVYVQMTPDGHILNYLNGKWWLFQGGALSFAKYYIFGTKAKKVSGNVFDARCILFM